MRNVEELKTKRLLMKGISLDDADFIVRVRSEPSVYQFFRYPHAISKEEHLEWYRENYLSNETRADWIAKEKDTGAPVGVFGIVLEDRKAEISYILDPTFYSKGYACEAVSELIEYAVKKGIKRVQAEIHENNNDSIVFIERLDFVLVDEKGDFVIYEKMVDDLGTKHDNMLYFRVDMNEEIATGHMMRCLSIADAAKKRGINSTFILADDSAVELLNSRGYESIVLGTNWRDMNLEIESLSKYISENSVCNILIDSYQVTEKYLDAINSLCSVAYIDDMDSFVYPVDTLVSYAIYSDEKRYIAKYPNKNLLIGPKYTPLRKEFTGLQKKTISKDIKKVLILSGGTDRFGVVDKIISTLIGVDSSLEVVGVCGRLSEQYDSLFEKYSRCKNVQIVQSIDNVAERMQWADLVISAAGTTLYELCACGTPTISFILADNQIENAETFDGLRLIRCIGDVRKNDISALLVELFEEYSDIGYRKYMSEKMQALVDGYGTERIIDSIFSICR